MDTEIKASIKYLRDNELGNYETSSQSRFQTSNKCFNVGTL